MSTVYKAVCTSTGGREGKVSSADGVLNLDLSLPKALGGQARSGATNPEQLFAAGYAACFENAILHLARMQKISVESSSVTAEVGIGPVASGGFGLSVALHVTLKGVDKAVAQGLVDTAHNKVCPYSNATRGNIPVEISLEV